MREREREGAATLLHRVWWELVGAEYFYWFSSVLHSTLHPHLQTVCRNCENRHWKLMMDFLNICDRKCLLKNTFEKSTLTVCLVVSGGVWWWRGRTGRAGQARCGAHWCRLVVFTQFHSCSHTDHTQPPPRTTHHTPHHNTLPASPRSPTPPGDTDVIRAECEFLTAQQSIKW